MNKKTINGKKYKLGLTVFFEIIFGSYFVFLLLEPILFTQTVGKTYGYTTEKIDYTTIHNARSKGTYSIQQTLDSFTMEYTYTVNDKEYHSSHISNMIIYPDPDDTQGYKTVYYNRFIPSFSILCPITFLYFLINNILFFITTLIMVIKYVLNSTKYSKKRRK